MTSDPSHPEPEEERAPFVDDDDDDPAPRQRPWDPQSVRVSTKTFSLRQVIDEIHDGTIDLAPGFQRPSVWKKKQQSRLVESVLLGIPLPTFYFNAEADRRLQVVDGVQRLTAIRDFADDKLVLEGLEYLTHLNGRTWAGLDASHRRGLHQTQIFVHVIDATTPPDVKTDIFKRINTGGAPLSAQEIRHAMSRERSRAVLGRMTSTAAFQRAMRDRTSAETRMLEREMALRFLAFTLDPRLEEYEAASTFDDFLMRVTRRLDNANALPDERVHALEAAFERAMTAAWELFDGHAFSLWPRGEERRKRINRALFDSWSVALSEHDVDALVARREEIVQGVRDAFSDDPEYVESVRQGTNVKERILKRFQVARAILRGG